MVTLYFIFFIAPAQLTCATLDEQMGKSVILKKSFTMQELIVELQYSSMFYG